MSRLHVIVSIESSSLIYHQTLGKGHNYKHCNFYAIAKCKLADEMVGAKFAKSR
jgi:hypothetical protein